MDWKRLFTSQKAALTCSFRLQGGSKGCFGDASNLEAGGDPTDTPRSISYSKNIDAIANIAMKSEKIAMRAAAPPPQPDGVLGTVRWDLKFQSGHASISIQKEIHIDGAMQEVSIRKVGKDRTSHGAAPPYQPCTVRSKATAAVPMGAIVRTQCSHESSLHPMYWSIRIHQAGTDRKVVQVNAVLHLTPTILVHLLRSSIDRILRRQNCRLVRK